MAGSAALGRVLVACAGIALGQAWAFADGQGKPVASKPVAQAAAVQKVAPGCTGTFPIPDSSFQALSGGGLRDAMVWVDDIDSGLSGRFEPFPVYVVTGRVYAPFPLKQGKLGRDGFRKLTAGNYNAVVYGPLVINRDARKGQQAFKQDNRDFTLRVVGVEASTFRGDTISAQLCW